MSPPLTSEQEAMLEHVYQNNRFGRNRVIDALRLAYPNQDIPSYRQTLEWLKGQTDHQIHSRPTKSLTIGPITQLSPGHVQADLFIMSSYVDRGYRSALVVIDVFTKYVAATALRSESEAVVTAAMRAILHSFPVKVTTCQTDPGSHFKSTFGAMLKSEGVEHLVSQVARPQSNSVVERSNGVIKGALFKQMVANRDRRWAMYLPVVVKSINELPSFTTGESPDELVKASPEEQAAVAERVAGVLDRRYPSQVIGVPLAVGSYVRLKRQLGQYQKAGVQGYWSSEVYTVKRVIISKNPQIIPTYAVEDSGGNAVPGRQPRSNLLLIPKPGGEAQDTTDNSAPEAPLDPVNMAPTAGPAEPDDPRRSLRKQGEYQIEYIDGVRGRGRSKQYHVKWLGYSADQSSWEPLSHLRNAKEAIDDFLKGG